MARYFLSKRSPITSIGGIGSYWKGTTKQPGWTHEGATYAQVFASGKDTSLGLRCVTNLHLLAHARGDIPQLTDPGQVLVSPLDYNLFFGDPIHPTYNSKTIRLQPFVQADNPQGLNAVALPIGDGLRSFLDDPLGIGGSLNLLLPFSDERISMSQAWMREDSDPGDEIHGGCDLRAALKPRPLHDVCASADGEVVMLLKAQPTGTSGGVVLSHSIQGKNFLTLYQHVDPNTITCAVGDSIKAGAKIGKIRHWPTGPDSERTHNHFNLLVSSPAFDLGGEPIPELWYSIDPFGVYDYRDDSHYIPVAVGGLTHPIRGAERTIHWAGNPPIQALPTEQKTAFEKISQIQVRVRSASQPANATPPEEDQALVWLEGIDDSFVVRLGTLVGSEFESEMMRTLRKSRSMDKRVRLGYRWQNGQKHITAVWIQN